MSRARRFTKRFAGDQTRYHSPVPSQPDFKFSKGNDNGTTTGNIPRHRQQHLQISSSAPQRRKPLLLRDFIRSNATSSPVFPTTKQPQAQPFPVHNRTTMTAMTNFVGNRGEPSLHWRPGLREPECAIAGKQSNTTTLFVDNIPNGLARTWFRNLFQRWGNVADVFISAKIRRNRDVLFGFVRYATVEEAKTAIEKVSGLAVQGRKLRVSMARYERGGAPVRKPSTPVKKNKNAAVQKRWFPALRDNRSYLDVAQGLKQKVEKLESIVTHKSTTIPAIHSLNVAENMDVAEMLKKAVIAENTMTLHLPQFRTKLSACKGIHGILSLSPTKLLIVFDSIDDSIDAVNEESPLWKVFDDVRLWSEGESFDDRLVWVECVGIHPICCSKENLTLIGEKWGPVLNIHNIVQGIRSITSARILLRTKAQNRIDNRIKLLCEHTTCDVWVKELSGYYGGSGDCDTEALFSPTPIHVNYDRSGALNNSKNSTQSLSFSDPLMQELSDRPKNREEHGWTDPMILDENIRWVSATNLNPYPYLRPPVSNTTPKATSSRPRGRPRKLFPPQIPLATQSNGSLEAEKTWETAQLLGISSYEEEAVLEGLRNSKRILTLEGEGD